MSQRCLLPRNSITLACCVSNRRRNTRRTCPRQSFFGLASIRERLLAFSAGGIVLFLAISAGGIWFLTESEGDGDEPGSSGESETVLSVPPKLFDKESEPESKSVEKNDDEPVSSVSTRVVDESRIQYRGTQSLIFLPNSLSPFSEWFNRFGPMAKKARNFPLSTGLRKEVSTLGMKMVKKKKSLP